MRHNQCQKIYKQVEEMCYDEFWNLNAKRSLRHILVDFDYHHNSFLVCSFAMAQFKHFIKKTSTAVRALLAFSTFFFFFFQDSHHHRRQFRQCFSVLEFIVLWHLSEDRRRVTHKEYEICCVFHKKIKIIKKYIPSLYLAKGSW